MRKTNRAKVAAHVNLMIVVSHIPVRIITADHNLQLIGLFKVFSFRNYYFFQKPHKEVQRGKSSRVGNHVKFYSC